MVFDDHWERWQSKVMAYSRKRVLWIFESRRGKMKEERLKLWGDRGSTPSKSSQEAKKKKKKSARDQGNTGIMSIKSSRHLSILIPWKIWVLCILGFFPSLKIFTRTWKLHLHLLLILLKQLLMPNWGLGPPAEVCVSHPCFQSCCHLITCVFIYWESSCLNCRKRSLKWVLLTLSPGKVQRVQCTIGAQ